MQFRTLLKARRPILLAQGRKVSEAQRAGGENQWVDDDDDDDDDDDGGDDDDDDGDDGDDGDDNNEHDDDHDHDHDHGQEDEDEDEDDDDDDDGDANLKRNAVEQHKVYTISTQTACYDGRKIRSQTSNKMERWKSRSGKSQRGEEKRRSGIMDQITPM